MKKIIAAIFCFLLLSLVSSSSGFMFSRSGGGGGGGQTVDYTQDFEGVGEPAGWAGVNSPDYDYTTTPLEGSEDLQLDGNDTASLQEKTGYTFTGTNEKWATFYWTNSGSGAAEYIAYFRASTSNKGLFSLTDTEEYRCQALGGSQNDSTATYTTDSTVKIKIYYKADDGGTNGTATLWTWNGSSWDQQCTSTNGNDANNIDNVFWRNNYGTGVSQEIDYVKIHSSDITSPD